MPRAKKSTFAKTPDVSTHLEFPSLEIQHSSGLRSQPPIFVQRESPRVNSESGLAEQVQMPLSPIQRQQQNGQTNTDVASQVEEDTLNTNFLSQVVSTPQVQQEQEFLSGSNLQQQYMQLQQKLSEVQQQMQNSQQTSQADTYFQKVLSDIEQFSYDIRNMENFEQSRFLLDIIKIIGSLQHSLLNYQGVVQNVGKLLTGHDNQPLEIYNIIQKVHSLTSSVSHRITSTNLENVRNNFELSYAQLASDLRQLRSQSYDNLNTLKQKYFSFIVDQYLVSTKSQNNDEKQNFQPQSAKRHPVSIQENPLYDVYQSPQNFLKQQQDSVYNVPHNIHTQGQYFPRNNYFQNLEIQQPPFQNLQKPQPAIPFINENQVQPQQAQYNQRAPRYKPRYFKNNRFEQQDNSNFYNRKNEEPFPFENLDSDAMSIQEVISNQKPRSYQRQPVRQSQEQEVSQNNVKQLAPPRFDKYTGETNAKHWLTRFERTCKRYDFSESEKLDEVLNQMSKNADRWAIRNFEYFDDFQTFKGMFLKRFSTPYELFQHQLLNEKQAKGDTYPQFLEKINAVAAQGDVNESTIKVIFHTNIYRRDVAFHLDRFLTDQNIDSIELCRQAQIIQNSLDTISQQQKYIQSSQKTGNNSTSSNYNRNYRNNNNRNNNYNNNNNSNNYRNNNQNYSNKQNYGNRQNYQNKNKQPYQKNDKPRMAYQQPTPNQLESIQEEKPDYESSGDNENQSDIYDQEQQPSESENADEEQSDKENQLGLNALIKFDQMIPVKYDPLKKQQAKTDCPTQFLSQVEVPKPVKESKVQQYFDLDTFFKNTNVNLKIEDLLLTSPQYFQQFQSYFEKLVKMNNGEYNTACMQPLNLLRPTYTMDKEICQVSVPETKSHLYVKMKIFNQEIFCFVDTGANKSCISKDFLLRNNINTFKKTKQAYSLMNGTTYIPEGYVDLDIEFDPQLKGKVEAAVVTNSQFDFVFGLDLFESFNCYTSRQQLFYKNPYKNRYSSLTMFKAAAQKKTQCSFLGFDESQKILDQKIFAFIYFTIAMFAQIGYFFSLLFIKKQTKINKNMHFGFLTLVFVVLQKIFQDFRGKQSSTCQPVLCNLTLGRSLANKNRLSTKFPKFPIKNKYQLIIVDFPWKYESDKFLKPPYQTMTVKELQKTPLLEISNKDCIYLFWTTGPKLSDCFQLIDHFKLKYLTCFSVWRKMDKNKLYNSKGSYTQPNYEYVLLASKGDISSFKRTSQANVAQEIQAQVQKHSAKPAKFYTVVQQVFKVEKIKCLEMFARIQKHSYLDLYGDGVKGLFSPSLKQLDKTYVDEKGMSKTFNNFTHMTLGPIQNRVYKYFQNSTNLEPEHLSLLLVPFQNTQYDFELILPILRIVSKSLQAFAFNEHEVGTTNVLQHTIELEENAKLKAQNPYRLTGPERDFVKTEIQHLENLGYIKRDVSPHAAPIVVVKKENGKFRMCIDFRDLNKFTVPHHWPLPQIDVLLTYLHGKSVFSKLDLRSGFFNISLKTEDQYKTSFVCSYGQYKYTRMPFGLRNAPSTFQHAMEEILRPVLYTFCLVYIDDVIVFSEDINQHYKHLQEVLNLIIQSGVKLHPEKCQIAVPEVEFLGHKVTYNKVFPKESKTAKVETLPPPTTVKQLQSFLGFASYYRKFIPGYSKVAKPLQMLIQKENKFEWEQPQKTSFETLKRIVTSQPHLKIPNLKSRFYLCTDFSNEGLGAVLSQYDEETKREKPIEYASRTLNIHEQKYGSYEGECLAVIWAFAKFRHYLLGKEFTLYTDNKALSWILSNKNPSPKIARWLLIIQEYNFQTFHRSGKQNSNADSLSRLAPLLTFQKNDCEILKLSEYLTFNSFNEIDEDQYYEQEPLYKPIDIGDLTCQVCNLSTNEKEMLLCESCGKGCHLKCNSPPLTEVPKEHFYCQACVIEFSKLTLNELDITIDQKAQEYLKNSDSINKLSQSEKTIIKQKTANYVFENGQLYKEVNQKRLFVPTLFQRTQILEEYHEQLSSHGGLRKTIDIIQTKYYWPRLEKSVLNFINRCVVCIANSKASFKAHNDLYTTQKGNSPFSVWSLDLITGLPETKLKNTIILVIVCCFSKWTEAFALQNKESLTIAKTFFENIVCRYGKPQIVRSDQGKEFQGSFQILLENLGTRHIVTSPYYAKSNGQVERTNRTLIQGLKKSIATKGIPLNSWDVILPHILFSLRFCVHKTTQYSPFKILYGKLPILMSPLDFEQKLDIPPVTQEFLKAYILKIDKIQKVLFPKVKENLEKTEVTSQDHYRTRLKTFQENVELGQLVFKNVGQRTTKLQLQATGPYRFIKYCNEQKTSCEIQDMQTQKTYIVSTSNIVPIPVV